MKQIGSIYSITLGTPEDQTPISVLGPQARNDVLKTLPDSLPPFDLSQIQGEQRGPYYTIRLPLSPGEQVFGMGLQLKRLNQTGRKKVMRPNADPVADTGDSHAPVPFYVTTAGYGVLVNSARYVSFHAGRRAGSGAATDANPNAASRPEDDLLEMLIEIPGVQGAQVLLFCGENMADAVNRYNLFCGGGPLVPLWGLGIWYRMFSGHNSDTVVKMARSFHEQGLPLDVVGLEPGWQTHAYPCTFQWDPARYPDPAAFLEAMNSAGLKVNLWEHCFTHRDSPLYPALEGCCGDYAVWGGRTPDFALHKTRRVFGGYHEKLLISQGVSGFKMDECDGSDYTGGWSFPNSSRFPSGLDGEQMHCLLGMLYQKTLLEQYALHDRRSYHSVRNAHALAASYPGVLYSDLYDHKDFIRGVTTMGFSGLLWSPEVRDAQSSRDLIRRVQTVVLSPQALINAWYIANPPWFQIDHGLNNEGKIMEDSPQVTAAVKALFNLRMALVPYLYSAFVRYHQTGRPPFRALVMDHPQDEATWELDDEYYMGEDMIVAPVTAQSDRRRVYLPQGRWHHFFTGRIFSGGWHEIDCPLNQIPVFIRDQTLLPLAEPLLSLREDSVFTLRPRIFGSAPRETLLYEDDGVRLSSSPSPVRLLWDGGACRLIRSNTHTPCRYRLD